MSHALILANGKPPSQKLLREYVRKTDFFICADGGANTAVRYRMKPRLVIGDLDSVRPRILKSLRHDEILRRPAQNSTDLEKAMTYAVGKKFTAITVLGATGGRIDHEVGNLSALAKFSRKARITFVDEFGMLISIGRRSQLRLLKGRLISLIPLTECKGIVTTGLRWNLHHETLRLGYREATSNIANATIVTVRVRSGEMLAFLSDAKPSSSGGKWQGLR